jgi:hypothetical protein
VQNDIKYPLWLILHLILRWRLRNSPDGTKDRSRNPENPDMDGLVVVRLSEVSIHDSAGWWLPAAQVCNKEVDIPSFVFEESQQKTARIILGKVRCSDMVSGLGWLQAFFLMKPSIRKYSFGFLRGPSFQDDVPVATWIDISE